MKKNDLNFQKCKLKIKKLMLHLAVFRTSNQSINQSKCRQHQQQFPLLLASNS